MMTAMSKRTYSLEELAKHVSGEVQGDGNITISAVGTLSGAASHQISFLTNPKYKPQLKDTQAGAVILLGCLLALLHGTSTRIKRAIG